ncbi:MAG: zinc-ribbon domain-containing protein [Candidatus Thorarchaeota archaeon]
MVRNLSLNYLYRHVGSRIEPESDSVCIAAALAEAESRKGANTRIVSLSKVSFPFWIVQTSSMKSILLTASSGVRQQFQYSEIKGISEIRRIVSSDVSQVEDVPVAVSKIEPLLDRVEISTKELVNLMNPSFMVTIGKFVETTDPSAQPTRVEIRTDSGTALKRSEEFKEITEAAELRIEASESLQTLVKEKLGGQMTILENLSKLESERWDDRVKTMEERTKQEIIEFTKNKDDQLYRLREKHKMDLRAMTADFSRSASHLEQFFIQIMEDVRDARTQIGQKEEDIEGAISVYNTLASNVRSSIQQSNQPLDFLDSKIEELQKRVIDVQEKYENEIAHVEESLASSIAERGKRIESTKSEMEQKMRELDELKAKVNAAVEKTKQAIGNKVMTFQKEFLSLMSWSLENDSINDLAPLTLLDVNTYVAKYDSESYEVLTPRFMLEEGLSSIATGKPLDQEFHETLTSSIENWMKSDPTFKDAFERACIRGNVFLDPESVTALNEGLTTLTRKNILQHSDKERFETLWSRYAGRCPKCGTATEMGAKFCQKCGLDLS